MVTGLLVHPGGHNEFMGRFVGYFVGKLVGKYPDVYCERDWSRDHARARKGVLVAEFINCKATWQDNSSGITDELGQEIQIWTDSPSFRPDVPIDYAVTPHPWMRLLPIAAGVTEAEFRLALPATFVTFRVRQYNAAGNGPWSVDTGTRFDISQTVGTGAPQAPSSPGFVITEGGVIVPPPPPPVDPPPPPPPTGGGGSASNYVFQTQFSGVQGQNQWSYLDANGTPMTYSSANQLWNGAQAYQGMWPGGIHPGTSVGSLLRWTAPSGGTALVSGSVNLYAASGTQGVTFQIKHNTTSIEGPTSLTNTVPIAISETVVMSSGDTLDFIVTAIASNTNCSTGLAPVIQFTTDGSTPAAPTLSTLSPATASVTVSGSLSLTATLTSAPATSASISIGSSDATKVAAPTAVIVPAGQTSALIPLTGVAAGSSTITATYNSTSKQSVITVANPPSGSWANAPTGGVVLLDHAFSTVTTTGLTTPYNNTFIVSDASAPFSGPNVARTRLEALARFGGDELTYQSPSNYREMYFGLYWRTNPQFQGRIVGNKLFFLRGVPGVNGVFVMGGGPNQGGGGYYLVWSFNTGTLNNSHLPGDGAYGNVAGSDSTLIPGLWYKIECHIRASTTASSRDGFIRWWINGTLTGSYDNINYASTTATAGSPGFLNQWVWNQTWDGSGDMGTSNTVPWEHYVDHVYIVGKN